MVRTLLALDWTRELRSRTVSWEGAKYTGKNHYHPLAYDDVLGVEVIPIEGYIPEVPADLDCFPVKTFIVVNPGGNPYAGSPDAHYDRYLEDGYEAWVDTCQRDDGRYAKRYRVQGPTLAGVMALYGRLRSGDEQPAESSWTGATNPIVVSISVGSGPALRQVQVALPTVAEDVAAQVAAALIEHFGEAEEAIQQ
jgi:hypothetical protein